VLEDAGHDFMRSPAGWRLWQMPEGIRVEHALQSGFEIPPFYDSMIAKIISHGATRDEARGKLICGLEQTRRLASPPPGILIDCLRHPAFRKARRRRHSSGNYRDDLLNAARGSKGTHAAARALLAL